jgi:PAS domain S-box-containing protein
VKSLESLTPDVHAALRAQAERDLARRIVFGAMVYFAMVVIVAWGTGYDLVHPATIGAFGTLTFVLGAGRLAAALRMRNETGPALFRWAGPLRRFTEAQLATWGAFGFWTLHLYGFEPVSLLVLMSTAAFSGGITSSLSPDLALARRGLLLIMLPPTMWGAFQGTRQGWVLAAFGTIYLVFLLMQVREHHRAYWTTSVSAAQAAASEGDKLFRVAFETANAGMALIDADGRFRKVNRRLCAMFSQTEDALLGSAFPSLLEEPQRRLDWLEALQAGIVTREREEPLVSRDGKPLWGAVSLAAVGEGRPEELRYYVAMILDVTERKRADAERSDMEARLWQAQKLEAIGTLAGGIAHDLNNLLGVIMGYADLVADQLQGSPQAADLREILRATDRARNLVDQLLAFSRRQTMQPEILNLNQILSETYELLQRTVGSHIRVDLNLDSLLQDVNVDAGQIQRVLLNLVLNARDAMPEGGRLSIATRMAGDAASDAATPLVALTVSDTGIGMSAETKRRAFEPFFTTKKSGSGLGLASVYGVVKQNGGEIRVESEPGQGTTVEILLPRASAADHSVPAKKTTPAAEPEGTSRTATVLVAEDEPALRRLIERSLKSAKYEVSSAANGEEALETFLKEPARFDILLTDVVMPGMSGRDLADRVRQQRPDLSVIYMTGYSASEIAERGVVEPKVTVLAKPFTPKDLRRALRRALGEKSTPAGA